MAAYKYVFPDLYKVPAQTVGEFCERLQASETGLSPRSFVEASRDPNSPTHPMIEWRDEIAAEAYREEQARKIIKNLIIVRETDDADERDRGFVVTPGGQSQYVTLESALGNEAWKAHLLKEARKDMLAFKAKYRRLTELAAVIGEMDKVQAAVG